MNANCYENVTISDVDKKHSETMLSILYNKHKGIPKEYKNIQKKFNNLSFTEI